VSAHDSSCRWAEGGLPCRRFSTDGTLLGAQIAHTMGTTDEEEILEFAREEEHERVERSLTGMSAEQADWEEEDR
jgi:hypothetical protein